MTSNDTRRGGDRLPKVVRAVVAATLAAAGLGVASPASPAFAVPPSAAPVQVRCGDVVISDVTLTADLVCPDNTALVVGADNLVIDLAGHTIRGPGSPGSGIEIGGHHNTVVDNGTISGFTSGISATGPGTNTKWGDIKLTVTRTRFTDNAKVRLTHASASFGGTQQTCALDGLSAVKSTVTVDDCTVHNAFLLDQTGATIRSSALSGGALRLEESSDGLYSGNVFDNFGISLLGESTRNLFVGNTMRNTATAISGSVPQDPETTNTIRDNVIRDNNVGFRSYDSTGYTITQNRFTGNRSAGVLVDNKLDRDNPEWISDNVFYSNGRSPNGIRDRDGNPVRGGIHLRTTPGSRIRLARNTGASNTGPLIWAPQGQVVDGGGNQGPCAPIPNPDLTCG
ncbi:right-handed parallel beta-helix repeat-containing protein [Streptosporangium sp. NPDC051022]|uniref:right-handed parallel beta-helix repeat-containing protein n=1 Tax=Streptosporangium sp. NPDC051022 TaxID=3155752 RepID=UPI0034186606